MAHATKITAQDTETNRRLLEAYNFWVTSTDRVTMTLERRAPNEVCFYGAQEARHSLAPIAADVLRTVRISA